jgi:hypothetical protein
VSSIDDLMAQIPIAQLAGQLGVSEDEARDAVRAALPALVGGMQANAQDPAGAASLQHAIGQHDGSLLDGGIDFDQVDTADGEKIVHNIFGDNEGAVVNQLGGLGGLSGGMISKLLPMLAPLLMNFLGKSFGGGGDSPASAPASGPASSSGMGPGASGMGPSSSPSESSGGDEGGGGLGDILGGLLGGGGLGGLGDVLGGLLGGGKK